MSPYSKMVALTDLPIGHSVIVLPIESSMQKMGCLTVSHYKCVVTTYTHSPITALACFTQDTRIHPM